jgi:hypothetical protein
MCDVDFRDVISTMIQITMDLGPPKILTSDKNCEGGLSQLVVKYVLPK